MRFAIVTVLMFILRKFALIRSITTFFSIKDKKKLFRILNPSPSFSLLLTHPTQNENTNVLCGNTNFKCGLGLERGPPSLVRTIG